MRFDTRPPRARLIAVIVIPLDPRACATAYADADSPRSSVVDIGKSNNDTTSKPDAEDEQHNRHDAHTTADQREHTDAEQHERRDERERDPPPRRVQANRRLSSTLVHGTTRSDRAPRRVATTSRPAASAKWHATWCASPIRAERRFLLDAHGFGERATRVEAAPGRRHRGARYVALEQDAASLSLPTRIGHRNRRHERVRVRVRGPLEHRVGRSDLDDLAEVHHRDEVRDVTDNREVVRDEDVRESELLLQVVEEVDDAGLDRHVERRHRLVEDQQLGIERERARDADALTLTARELVRISVRVVGVQPDQLHQLLHARFDLPLVASCGCASARR